MTHSVFKKFLIYYICLGIAGFFLTSAGGSYLIQNHLEIQTSRQLYREAQHIAENKGAFAIIKKQGTMDLQNTLSDMAKFQNFQIWITDTHGKILLNTGMEYSTPNQEEVSLAAERLAHKDCYEIGNFYGSFSNNQLSVAAPVLHGITKTGYVLIHYPMQNIYRNRSSFQGILLLVFFLLYGITLLSLILYRAHVHKPLQQIISGASEFGNGNLSHKIPVKTDDEMGYLANSLNYMADKLNRNGEYQRRFISNVSHDFRSPLTSIKGFVEAMLDGTIPPEAQEKYLKIIAYESERLEKLTESLLALNDLDIKKRLMHMHRFDINETLQTIAATFEGICAERDIHLTLCLCEKAQYVRADMEQIQQVLYNLLDNALKFSSNHSSIILETSEKNGKVFVSVKDHGSGIPKENLSKIWERFYKLDASRGKDRKGTGLGLSIVKEIINAHGQNINVISTVGVGTEFIFTLEKAK